MNGPNTILPQLGFEDLDSPLVDCLVSQLLGGRKLLIQMMMGACTCKLVLADTPPVGLVRSLLLRYLGIEAQTARVRAPLEGRVDG